MDEEKKQRQYHFLKVFILIAAILSSFLLGNYTASKEVVVDRPNRIQPNNNRSSHKIAVVDLDDGIELGKEKRYYSKEVIELPSLDFVHTGLGDARLGLEDGTYGAYIIIPSSFSKNISSINANPKKTKIEYEVKNNLDGDTKSHIIYNLLKFEKKLNNDLGYVYVNNILREFHEGQDISKKVMKNDLKDRQAILEIEPNDLVEMVDIPEFKRVDNTAEPIDFLSYMSENQNIILDIAEDYKRQIEVNLNDMYDLVDEGKNLIDELNKMISAVGQVNLLKDENGNLVYTDGRNELNNQVNFYNANLYGDKKDINEKVEDTLEQQNKIKDILLEVEEHNNNIEDKIENNKTIIKNSLMNSIPKMGTKMSNLRNNLEISYDNRGAGINIGIEKIEDEEKENAQKAYLQVIQRIMYEVNENDDIKNRLDEDEEFKEKIDEAGYRNLESILKSDISKKVSKDGKYRLIIKEDEEDIEAFQNYVAEKLEKFDPYIDMDKIGNDIDESTSILDLINNQERNINYTKEKIDKIADFNSIELNKTLEENILKPIELQANTIKNDYIDRYTIEKNLVDKYGKNINAYNPIDNTPEIRNKINEMNVNTSNLSTDLDMNSKEYLSLIDNVFENSDKNNNSLIESMQEATEASEKKVIQGLEDAKKIKDNTSKENQAFLDSFSKKLGYTRLGSLEYTKVYEFIVNPVNIENSSDIIKNDTDIEEEVNHSNYKNTDYKDKMNLISDNKALIITGVSTAFLLIIYVLLSRKKA